MSFAKETAINTQTQKPHMFIVRHTLVRSNRPADPLRDILFLFFIHNFYSTFTVIKAHIASAPLSRAKWFVTICVDTEILFPLRMCCLDSVLSYECICAAGTAFISCSHSFPLSKRQKLYTLKVTWCSDCTLHRPSTAFLSTQQNQLLQ